MQLSDLPALALGQLHQGTREGGTGGFIFWNDVDGGTERICSGGACFDRNCSG